MHAGTQARAKGKRRERDPQAAAMCRIYPALTISAGTRLAGHIHGQEQHKALRALNVCMCGTHMLSSCHRHRPPSHSNASGGHLDKKNFTCTCRMHQLYTSTCNHAAHLSPCASADHLHSITRMPHTQPACQHTSTHDRKLPTFAPTSFSRSHSFTPVQ